MTLPPLPEPDLVHATGYSVHAPMERSYSAEQMQAYAAAAVMAEREALIREVQIICRQIDDMETGDVPPEMLVRILRGMDRFDNSRDADWPLC